MDSPNSCQIWIISSTSCPPVLKAQACVNPESRDQGNERERSRESIPPWKTRFLEGKRGWYKRSLKTDSRQSAHNEVKSSILRDERFYGFALVLLFSYVTESDECVVRSQKISPCDQCDAWSVRTLKQIDMNGGMNFYQAMQLQTQAACDHDLAMAGHNASRVMADGVCHCKLTDTVELRTTRMIISTKFTNLKALLSIPTMKAWFSSFRTLLSSTVARLLTTAHGESINCSFK